MKEVNFYTFFFFLEGENEQFETTITAYSEDHAKELFELLNLQAVKFLKIEERPILPAIVFPHEGISIVEVAMRQKEWEDLRLRIVSQYL